MRHLFYVLSFVVLIAVIRLPLFAQDAPQAVTQRANDQWDEKTNDKVLWELLFDRYAAAYVEMEARTALYNAGRVTLADVCAAITRYSVSGLELAKTPAGRLAICEQAFKEAKEIEKAAEAKYKHDIEPVQQLMLATYTRCDMEIKLLKAKKEKAADKSGDESEAKSLIAP